MRSWGAVQTGTDLNLEFVIKNGCDFLRIQGIKTRVRKTQDAHDQLVRKVIGERTPPRKPADGIHGAASQGQFVLTSVGDRLLFQPPERGIESKESGGVVIAGFVFVRQAIRLAILFAVRTGTTLSKTGDVFLKAGTQIEQSRAERAEQSFVTRTGE
jgi:hypothetical protein